MALHLITGVPGAGKTLNTLRLVHTKAAQQGRPVYYRGIKLLRDNPHGINYDNWFEMRHPNDDGVDLQTDVTPWSWQNAPDGAIIFVDEAHHFYPATSPTARHPAYIMDMSEHRHRGIDIYLITQGPDLVNSTIKNWVNEHHHYRLLFGGLLNICYINDKCINNVRNTREISGEASKKRIKHDKRWYDAYISASIHYRKKRVPKGIIFGLITGLMLILGGIVYSNYAYFGQGAQQTPLHPSAPVQPSYVNPRPTAPYRHDQPLSGDNYNPLSSDTVNGDQFNPLIAYKPRIEAMPETAPAYDDLRKAQTWPKPQCLIAKATDKCTCYTQQATVMHDYPDTLCREYAMHGYFDPTRKDPDPLRQDDKRNSTDNPAAPPQSPLQGLIPQTSADNSPPKYHMRADGVAIVPDILR